MWHQKRPLLQLMKLQAMESHCLQEDQYTAQEGLPALTARSSPIRGRSICGSMVQLYVGGQIGCCAAQVQLAGLFTVTLTSGLVYCWFCNMGLAELGRRDGTASEGSLVGWLSGWLVVWLVLWFGHPVFVGLC